MSMKLAFVIHTLGTPGSFPRIMNQIWKKSDEYHQNNSFIHVYLNILFFHRL